MRKDLYTDISAVVIRDRKIDKEYITRIYKLKPAHARDIFKRLENDDIIKWEINK